MTRYLLCCSIIILFAAEINSYSLPPPCISNSSELVYINGQLSATRTYARCVNNIPDPLLIPTLSNGGYNFPLLINVSTTFNNIDGIDEIAGTSSLQFNYKMYWHDERLAMPIFWNQMTPYARKFGIDLTEIVQSYSELNIWQPVIRFPDAASVNRMVWSLRVNASNVVVLSQGFEVTLSQPKFNFRLYPDDRQMIDIRILSFTYPSIALCVFGFNGNPIVMNENYDGTLPFASNPIWLYDASSSYADTYVDVPNGGVPYVVYHMQIQRQSSGVITRFVLPITLLLLLASLTFWIVSETRVNTAITLLLSVSSLYIVILSNIPKVGYLTAVDKFVFTMYVLLIVVVNLHQANVTLLREKNRWPLRPLFVRLVEGFGRLFMIPFVVLNFLFRFGHADETVIALVITVLVGADSYLLYREYYDIREVTKTAFKALLAKVTDDTMKMKKYTDIELFVFNYWKFKVYSRDLKYINEYRAAHPQSKKSGTAGSKSTEGDDESVQQVEIEMIETTNNAMLGAAMLVDCAAIDATLNSMDRDSMCSNL